MKNEELPEDIAESVRMKTKPSRRRRRSAKHVRNPRTIHPQQGTEDLEIFGGERGIGHGVDELAEPAGPPVPLYRQKNLNRKSPD